jgi:hypothetical protein
MNRHDRRAAKRRTIKIGASSFRQETPAPECTIEGGGALFKQKKCRAGLETQTRQLKAAQHGFRDKWPTGQWANFTIFLTNQK